MPLGIPFFISVTKLLLFGVFQDQLLLMKMISLSLSSGKFRFLASFRSFLYCPVNLIVLILQRP